MTTRYLCIDPEWSGGTPPDNILTSTIYSGVRFVARPDLWPVVGRMLTIGVNVQLVIARESGNPAQYFDWATSDWMLPRVSWVVGNEPDGSGPSSWTMTTMEYAMLWQASRGLHGARWVAGMVSGNTAKARQYLQPDAAGMAVHIYTLNPTGAKQAMTAYGKLGVPLWVGETHPSEGYKLADYTWSVPVNDFCFTDQMVPGMGLYA